MPKFIFSVLLVISSVCAMASEPRQTQSYATATVELDTRDSRFHLDDSRFHLERDGRVSMRLSWAQNNFCVGHYRVLPNVIGHQHYHDVFPGPINYPHCNVVTRTKRVPVAGLKRLGDEVVYTAESGMETVCATIATRVNWLRRKVTTFYPTGNCVVKVSRVGRKKVARLVIR